MVMTEKLRSQADFARNPRCYRTSRNAKGGDHVVAGFLGAHCAGMFKKSSAEEVRSALLNEPNENCPANPTIRWLLGSLAIHEVQTLCYRGGVPLGRIADHVRWHDLQRPKLIHFLNQFANPDFKNTDRT